MKRCVAAAIEPFKKPSIAMAPPTKLKRPKSSAPDAVKSTS
jgi:hypothetical protein